MVTHNVDRNQQNTVLPTNGAPNSYPFLDEGVSCDRAHARKRARASWSSDHAIEFRPCLRLSVRHTCGCRAAAPNDSTHLVAAQPQLACRSYCGVAGPSRTTAPGCCRTDSSSRDPCEIHREIGSRASRDFGFRAAARHLNARALPRKYFWLWSSKDKNAFFLARLPISRSPCKISLVRGGLESPQQLLRIRLQFGSPRPAIFGTRLASAGRARRSALDRCSRSKTRARRARGRSGADRRHTAHSARAAADATGSQLDSSPRR
jgi:hypothetical protein